jgi:hypothetical protein
VCLQKGGEFCTLKPGEAVSFEIEPNTRKTGRSWSSNCPGSTRPRPRRSRTSRFPPWSPNPCPSRNRGRLPVEEGPCLAAPEAPKKDEEPAPGKSRRNNAGRCTIFRRDRAVPPGRLQFPASRASP